MKYERGDILLHKETAKAWKVNERYKNVDDESKSFYQLVGPNSDVNRRRDIDVVEQEYTKVGHVDSEKFRVNDEAEYVGQQDNHRASIVKEEIEKIREKTVGEKVDLDILHSRCESRGLSEYDVKNVVESMKRKGEIYEPTKDVIETIE